MSALLRLVSKRGLAALLLALAGLLAVDALLFAPPAQANVFCRSTDPEVPLNFGNGRTATGEIHYSCQNFDPTPTSFTLCAGFGEPSYPGTATQPRLQGPGGSTIDYNVYVNQAATQLWTVTNPITLSLTVPPSATVTGTITFYGVIPAGQPAPTAAYEAYIYQTILGFRASGATTCVDNLTGFQGQRITVHTTATVAPSCTLGTIAAIDFGTPSGVWTQVDAAGSVQVTCPTGTPWTLRFDGGQQPLSGERRMRSAQGNYIPYRLYRDNGRTQLIAIDGTITGTGTSAVQTSPVYGRVTVSQIPPVGNYSDAVIVVLSF